MKKILISICLLGFKTQWDENTNTIPELDKLVISGNAVFICPEQFGGLATPREPSEIEYGKTAKDVIEGRARITSKSGKDVTREYMKGAKDSLEICKRFGIDTAILKDKSPSCGSLKTYDGSFTKTKRKGAGITAELLMQNGIKVYNENNYPKELLQDL